MKLIGANPWRNRNERELKNSLAKRLYRNSLGYLHIIVDLFTVFCLENKNRGRDSFLMSFFSLDLISTCDDWHFPRAATESDDGRARSTSFQQTANYLAETRRISQRELHIDPSRDVLADPSKLSINFWPGWKKKTSLGNFFTLFSLYITRTHTCPFAHRDCTLRWRAAAVCVNASSKISQWQHKQKILSFALTRDSVKSLLPFCSRMGTGNSVITWWRGN